MGKGDKALTGVARWVGVGEGKGDKALTRVARWVGVGEGNGLLPTVGK